MVRSCKAARISAAWTELAARRKGVRQRVAQTSAFTVLKRMADHLPELAPDNLPGFKAVVLEYQAVLTAPWH
jgi:hypothetical protein